MALANTHYYATRDPLGQGGDFTTAPEISQMFGEMIGLWLADLWSRTGQKDVALVELGPGRGTLMADIQRSFSKIAGNQTNNIHLVETSPTLRREQAKIIPNARWHDDVSTLPDHLPLFIIANEFFDALPIRQLVQTETGWRERMVGIKDDAFVPIAGSTPMDAAVPPSSRTAKPGAIIETSPASIAVMAELSARVAQQGGAMLAIDYGYAGPAVGDTLQAVKAHRYADIFENPGDADLTAHVDFTALAECARQSGAAAYGPVDQGALLTMLGIQLRAAQLIKQNPDKQASLTADLHRLIHQDEMGQLFKAIAVLPQHWPVPAGFEAR